MSEKIIPSFEEFKAGVDLETDAITDEMMERAQIAGVVASMSPVFVLVAMALEFASAGAHINGESDQSKRVVQSLSILKQAVEQAPAVAENANYAKGLVQALDNTIRTIEWSAATPLPTLSPGVTMAPGGRA